MRLFTSLLALFSRPEASERQREVIRACDRQEILAKYRQPQRDPKRRQAFQQRVNRYRDQGIPLRLQERARYDIRALRVGKRNLAA